jgi:DNA-directed RNA polymerase subunit H (RpoH/RPB5)
MADIFKVFTAYSVLLDILKTRGFDVSEYEGFSKTQIASMLASNKMDLMMKSGKKKVYVRFELEKAPDLLKLADQFFEAYEEEAILTTEDDLIIVSKDPANDSKYELMNDLWENRKIFISIYSLPDLQFNKFKAALVPPSFKILSDQETREIMAKYFITELHQFPNISRYDAIGTLLGIRPGQVCEIKRSSVAALDLDFYRVCM